MRFPPIFFAVAFLALAGCAPANQRVYYHAEYVLAAVHRSPAAARTGGEMAAPVRVARNTWRFQDDALAGQISLPTRWTNIIPSQFDFRLENRTGSTLRLVWDDAVFIGPRGTASRILHEGTRFDERNAPQAASLIPPLTALEDFAIPSSNVFQSDGGSWHVATLVSLQDDAATSIFGLRLPMDVNGERREYTFWFRVRDRRAPPGSFSLPPSH